jgi:chitin disaccharide deacetylase
LKQLIVNADDFGFTRDVNAGIVHAHREGILTATTLMANGEAFDDAVRLAQDNPTLDIGCHLVLVQGTSLVSGEPLPRNWKEVLLRLATGHLQPYRELRPQVERILAAGIRPTHLDSHKHTHVLPNVFRAVLRLAEEFRIPWIRLPMDRTTRRIGPVLGSLDPLYRSAAVGRRVCFTDHFLGFRLTGSLEEASLSAALNEVQDGTTELMCHPGMLTAELQGAPTRLKESRVRELEALTSPRVRRVMDARSIRLATFADLSPGDLSQSASHRK